MRWSLGYVFGTLVLQFLCSASSPAHAQNGEPGKRKSAMKVTSKSFGSVSGQGNASLFTCTNSNGVMMQLTDYGAIVVALHVPDRDGNLANVTLGFDSVQRYVDGHPFFGATVGRYCNRIALGKFKLNGHEYKLATNNGPNHLHGGDKGFDKYLWQARPFEGTNEVGVAFHRRSVDGEEGYPGNLDATAVYTLTNANELRVELTAKTDHDTVVNLTNHCYWNLSGAGAPSILAHELMLNAQRYLPVDATGIPTGELASVEDTPMDFRTSVTIGSRIGQLVGEPGGYDHNYVLTDGPVDQPRLAARVKDPKSGRVMEIHTTQPGIQFYTGNYLDGSADSGGYPKNAAFCLETQHFPDSPNQSHFPSTVLKPGESYRHVTVHRFLTE